MASAAIYLLPDLVHRLFFFPGIKKRHVIDTVPLAIVLRDVAYRIIGTHRK